MARRFTDCKDAEAKSGGIMTMAKVSKRDELSREEGPALIVSEEAMALLVDMSDRMCRIENMLGAKAEPEERWWTPDEVAKKVERVPLTVREWARLGKIPSKKDSRGRRWISDGVAQLIFQYQGLPPEEELSSLSNP
jgi:hypothetical protein